MRTIQATVTGEGQVTLPADVRRQLGLSEHGQVNFVMDEEGVRLEKPRFTLESAFGSVPGIPGTSDDFDREIEEAMAIEVARLVRPRDDS